MIIGEEAFVHDPKIRAAAAREELAIVFLNPGILAFFDVAKGDARQLQEILTELAAKSGFPEIEHAPLLTFGHSTAGHFARNVAYWNPGRVFGVIYFKSGQIAPPAWVHGSIANVPFLAINGEFEEFGPRGPHPAGESWESQWRAVQDTLLRLRAQHYLVSQIVEPGAGHFTWSDRLADYTARFIRKAAHYKLPAHTYAIKGPVRLHTPPETGGWLTDTLIKPAPRYAPASFRRYRGNPREAFWHLDEEMARAWEEFHRGAFGKADQTVAFADASVTPDRDRIAADKVLNADKQTFTVRATASSGLPARFRLNKGPAVQIGPNTFRILAARYDNGGLQDRQVQIIAYQEGSERYRYAERIGQVDLVKNQTGPDQVITFEPIAEKQSTAPRFAVEAASSAGLPVELRVLSGPALLEGHTLTISGLPAGSSKTSFEVILLGGQWGNARVKTAPAASLAFSINIPAKARL